MNIARLLKAWRIEKGFNQEEAAVFLGSSVSALRAWEQGKRRPLGFAEKALLKIILPPGHSFEFQTQPKEDAKAAA